MKLSNLNESLSLLANLGVLAGIIILAIEIQQNTNMMKAQTRDSITDKQLEWFLSVGTNPYSAEILSRGQRDQEAFSQNQQEGLTFTFITLSNFRMWENELYQFEMGLFDEAEFQPRVNQWKRLLESNAGIRAVWINTNRNYSPELRNLLGTYGDD